MFLFDIRLSTYMYHGGGGGGVGYIHDAIDGDPNTTLFNNLMHM